MNQEQQPQLSPWEVHTDVPCPGWCQRPTSHPYTLLIDAAGLSRTHTRDLGSFVQIVQHERAFTAIGPIERDAPIAYTPDGLSMLALNAADLDQLSRETRQAAAELRRIDGGPGGQQPNG